MKTKSMTIWVMVVVLCLTSPKAMGWLQFKDGGTHNIDCEIAEDVWVDYQAPGMQTTVNWLDGGQIFSPYYVKAFEDSQLNILGGVINSYLHAYHSSQVTVSGGRIDNLYAYNSSQVSISSGLVSSYLRSYHSSQVSISGGSISYLYPNDSSQVTISGGMVERLRTYDSSQVNISGGSIPHLFLVERSQSIISGGSIGEGELIVASSAILKIDGSDFAVDGQPFGYGELTSILGGSYENEPYRQLTGILLRGDPINNQFRIGNDASIFLVPEPATLFLLGLGGLILRRKRRRPEYL